MASDPETGEAVTAARLIASRIIPSLGKCVWCSINQAALAKVVRQTMRAPDTVWCRQCGLKAWSELTPIGSADYDGVRLEHANCSCRSTLCREVREAA